MTEKSRTSRWWRRVRMNPSRLQLRMDDRVQFMIENRSRRRLSYKVKTTRHHAVFPNQTYGFVEPGETVAVKILYRPIGTDRPLGRGDHLTIVVKPVDCDMTDPRGIWQESEQRSRNFRVELRDAKRKKRGGRISGTPPSQHPEPGASTPDSDRNRQPPKPPSSENEKNREPAREHDQPDKPGSPESDQNRDSAPRSPATEKNAGSTAHGSAFEL